MFQKSIGDLSVFIYFSNNANTRCGEIRQNDAFGSIESFHTIAPVSVHINRTSVGANL
jgi:hypothetical protein